MTTYVLEPLSYLKPVLHAAKHPADTCIGLVTGTIDLKGKAVAVQDAIPLLHHWTDLSPMMEVALQMAEIYARKQGQAFLGLYVANARLEDTSVPASVTTVADAIKKDFPQAVVFVLDNENMASASPAFIPYLSSSTSSTWTRSTFSSPTFTLSDPTSPAKALEQIRAGKHNTLGDFDDHAEDVHVDWLSNASVLP